MAIPQIAHFVFGLAPQLDALHPLHYVAMESCRRVLQPEQIYFHYKHLPYGLYWDLIRPHLTLVEVDLAPEVLSATYDDRLVPPVYRYAHHADFVRLDALLTYGGVYADVDTVFVNRFPPELFDHPFVIGREPPVRDERTGEVKPSLCNALMMAEPGSAFARVWRDQMASALNGTWSNHSGFLAYSLSRRMPEAVHIEPERSFGRYGPDRHGIAMLFEQLENDTEDVLSLHLWSHLWWDRFRRDFSDVHAGLLTEQHIRSVDTTYNVLARAFLPELALW